MPGRRRRSDALVESSMDYLEPSPDYGRRARRSDVGGDNARMREVKEIITALKDKLMERHLMSKKIAELERILRKINDATNKVMIEMDDRVDDLNRDWQKRLQIQNARWKDGMNALGSYEDSSKLLGTGSGSAYDVSNPMWRTERRLTEIVDRLAPIGKMEQKLEKIMKVLNRSYYYHSRGAAATGSPNEQSDIATARSSSSVQVSSSSHVPEIYGVVEMTETYSMCLRNLERAVKSLEAIKQMPAIIGIAPGGVSSMRDVDHAAKLLNQFVNKLRISLAKCNFRASHEMNLNL